LAAGESRLELLDQRVSRLEHALIEKDLVPMRAQHVVEVEHPRPVHRPVGKEHVVLVAADERPWFGHEFRPVDGKAHCSLLLLAKGRTSRPYLFSLLQELGALENFPLASEKRMG
jgi:hypothetical protein